MKHLPVILLGCISVCYAVSCVHPGEKTPPAVSASTVQQFPVQAATLALPEGFNAYWYAGAAEISVFEVQQERYGALRKAEQVNIFVTEDFSRQKQVKLDDPAASGSDRVPILKLNTLKRFKTGIYDYSLMQSVFSPVNGGAALKTSTTVQDWCGQIFTQVNQENGQYHVRAYSYFESEGDQDLKLPGVQLEEEFWTRIRLNPFEIKTGELDLIPSMLYQRLKHKPISVHRASVHLERGEKECKLSIQYLKISRQLTITFETSFPFRILGWEERHEGNLESKGSLKACRKSAYWQEHDNQHLPLRDSIFLTF